MRKSYRDRLRGYSKNYRFSIEYPVLSRTVKPEPTRVVAVPLLLRTLGGSRLLFVN
jgi:hypothetical protein